MNFASYLGSLILLALVAGCQHKTTTLALAEDPKAATEQIQNLTVGTTTTNAMTILNQQGFVCSVKRGDFSDGSNVLKNIEYIDFYKSQTAGWPVQRRYWGGLILSNGKVSSVKLFTGLVGP